MLQDYDLEQLVEPLQTWFMGHARILPWRENPRAYYVWISEIMLQQTRVEAVKPYFERFIRELPDVEALAGCPEDKLLKRWEGLGYYNRARNLKAAAIQIMEDYDGIIPSEYEELLKLKGIGNYTAGAIASIAYGKPVPAVDGNVLRVISRVTADDSDIMKQSTRKQMEERLFALINSDLNTVQEGVNPAVFNQALMELGATVCVPNGAPHCEECPWNALCEARKQSLIEKIPVKTKAKARRIEEKTVLIIKDGEKLALSKRPEEGLLAGLYELPNLEGHRSEEELVEFVREQGYEPVRIQPVGDAKHIFSHVEWHMKGYVVFLASREYGVTDANYAGTLADGTDAMGTVAEEEHGIHAAPWEFIDVEETKHRYAIPSAFSKYMKYLNLVLGKEAAQTQMDMRERS